MAFDNIIWPPTSNMTQVGWNVSEWFKLKQYYIYDKGSPCIPKQMNFGKTTLKALTPPYLLKEKIASGNSPVSNFFPEYKAQGGTDEDYDAIVEFFTVSSWHLQMKLVQQQLLVPTIYLLNEYYFFRKCLKK